MHFLGTKNNTFPVLFYVRILYIYIKFHLSIRGFPELMDKALWFYKGHCNGPLCIRINARSLRVEIQTQEIGLKGMFIDSVIYK